jgi:glycosyltransferase involved in cell wall biosynthesis
MTAPSKVPAELESPIASAPDECPSQRVACWTAGDTPVAVVMISLNEAHNMEAVCRNLAGWAQEVFLVDSFSQDETVDIALRHGINVVQRRFRGFGNQWNFAISRLPITAPWTMKLDPDELLSDELKASIRQAIREDRCDACSVVRRLWFMGRPLGVRQTILRLWKTGSCRFSDVAVNEYPRIEGRVCELGGDLEHHDSPDLEHWIEKQNRYSTAEAIMAAQNARLAAHPRLFGSPLERRIWLKKWFWLLPGRFWLLFLYNYFWLGAWAAGRPGYIWARLRSDVMRLIEYKRREISSSGRCPAPRPSGPGIPDLRVRQAE